jgi:hypothetical protein
MVTGKNCAAFVLIALASWRVMACSASTGPTGGGYGAAAGNSFLQGSGSTPGVAPSSTTRPGSGGSGAIVSNGSGGSFINLGTSGNAGSNVVTRDMDSSCHPITETPEKIIITDSSIVTDTITTLTPVAIFIMQDRSSSMIMQAPGAATGTSWQHSTDAVTAFVKDPMSTGLDVGLGVFPPMSNNNQPDCTAGSDCGMPVVPIASLPGNANTLVSAYQRATPMGLLLTPTECALRGMINTCLQFMSSSASGEKCVAVLVTDGTPTTCDVNETDLEAIITDGAMKGVETYTIGLPGADTPTLDAYAAAGGTMKSIDVTNGDPAALIAAFNSIRGKVSHQEKKTITTMHVVETPLKCQWKIPPQPMGAPALDPTKVNVVFTPPMQMGQTFGHVKCDGACTAMMPPATCPATNAAGGAWYYDDEKNPTQVFLCPVTCDAIKNVQDATVDLLFHCPIKILPVQ